MLDSAVKAAIKSHHTATSAGAWDGSVNEARLSNDAGADTYRQAFAWVDPAADPATKAAYKFIHHEVGGDGGVGSANWHAAATGIGVLNGGRTGTTIPDSDFAGVAAHLNAHLVDAGREALPLKSASDELLARAVKFTGPDTIEGPGMPFGGPFAGKDVDGEAFDAATDFCFDWFGPSGRPILYEHGFDRAVKTMVVGRQSEYEQRDDAIWVQSQLDRSARYRKAIDSLIEEGALGYSSGAMPHLATKNRAGIITRWPWVETSLTPIPAHPGTMVHYVKSADAIAHLEAVDLTLPGPLKAALTALDEWADSKPDGLGSELSYADDLTRVLGEVEALTSRSVDRAAWRGKAGRVLSAANRARLGELRSRISASTSQAAEVLKDLDELLTSTDPDDAAKRALWAAVLDVEVQRARALGVPIQGVPA